MAEQDDHALDQETRQAVYLALDALNGPEFDAVVLLLCIALTKEAHSGVSRSFLLGVLRGTLERRLSIWQYQAALEDPRRV